MKSDLWYEPCHDEQNIFNKKIPSRDTRTADSMAGLLAERKKERE